ncbi:MAG: cytochrome [Bdellovibrionales bacterium]|nr:cytochrome [Bdellovibrionales bacterium]
MYLQGNLQAVFDALYHLGVIDPVLKMDWNKELNDLANCADEFFQAMDIANTFQGSIDDLMVQLRDFDQRTLSYLAMEVAREFADFHSRDCLH